MGKKNMVLDLENRLQEHRDYSWQLPEGDAIGDALIKHVEENERRAAEAHALGKPLAIPLRAGMITEQDDLDYLLYDLPNMRRQLPRITKEMNALAKCIIRETNDLIQGLSLAKKRALIKRMMRHALYQMMEEQIKNFYELDEVPHGHLFDNAWAEFDELYVNEMEKKNV